MAEARLAQQITGVDATPEGYNVKLRVEGKSSAGGSDFALEAHPYREGPPEDGVLDLDLVTRGDGAAAGAGVVTMNLENLENYWGEDARPLCGVRVHSQTNTREVVISVA